MNVRDQGAHADIASLLLRAMIGHLQAPSRRRATEEQAGPSDQAWRHWGQFTGLSGVLLWFSWNFCSLDIENKYFNYLSTSIFF